MVNDDKANAQCGVAVCHSAVMSAGRGGMETARVRGWQGSAVVNGDGGVVTLGESAARTVKAGEGTLGPLGGVMGGLAQGSHASPKPVALGGSGFVGKIVEAPTCGGVYMDAGGPIGMFAMGRNPLRDRARHDKAFEKANSGETESGALFVESGALHEP